MESETELSLYSKIEQAIIKWSNAETETAGSLTRKIMELIEEDKKKNVL